MYVFNETNICIIIKLSISTVNYSKFEVGRVELVI